MAFPPRWVNAAGGTGNLNGVTAGTSTAGNTLATNGIEPGTLTLLANVLAETNTLTITVKFQVSIDQTTWYDLAGDAQNPANVVLATGTAGADTATTRVLPVPPQIQSWPYIRAAIVNGVATGATADTYALTWYYRRFSGF